jgi:hypothetical protein
MTEQAGIGYEAGKRLAKVEVEAKVDKEINKIYYAIIPASWQNAERFRILTP